MWVSRRTISDSSIGLLPGGGSCGLPDAGGRLVSCPRNSPPNFWDKRATRINNLCPAATRNLIRRISESGHWISWDRYKACSLNPKSDKCGGIQMDSLITAAAQALASGDPLGALNWVALREDAPALALRGIAMAQLGELARAKVLLRRAAS